MKISIKLGQRLPSFTKSPTSQDKFHSYMMIKRVVDRFLSTGSVHICSQNQNIPVQTANGHSAACPRPRWGGWRRTCWSERASTWRAATSSTCSRNTRIGLPRNEYSKSPSILWRIVMLLCLKCWNITVLDVVTSFCHLCSTLYFLSHISRWLFAALRLLLEFRIFASASDC